MHKLSARILTDLYIVLYRSSFSADEFWEPIIIYLPLIGSIEDIKAEIEELEDRFNTLKMSTIKCFEKIQVSVMSVVYILTSLRAGDLDEHRMFLKGSIQKLGRCPSHWMLFGELNFQWTYLSYHLLDCLIKEVSRTYRLLTDVEERTVEQSLTDIKRLMNSYKTDLKEFRKRTPLELFCHVERGNIQDPPPGFKSMVVKFNWPITTTLEDVEVFRQRYVHHYNLRDCAMMLNSIGIGTYTVTWFVPSSIVGLLKRRAPNVFIEFNIKRVEFPGVDRHCVYEAPVQRNVS